jgi:ketosteroid isomerase-like protein
VPPEGNVEIVRRTVEAFDRGKLDVLPLLADDVELVEWPEGPDQRTYRGHSGAIKAFESWFEVWASVRVEVEEIVEAGDQVLLCGKTHGKGKGSAVEVSTDAFNVYTIRDGKVARIEFFTRKEPALEAAGLTANIEENK